MVPDFAAWRVTMLVALVLTTCSPKTAGTQGPAVDPESAAALLADTEAGKYGTLDQLINTGLTFQLRPDKSGQEGLFTLEIANTGTSAAVVEKVGMAQVGRISTGTTASEDSKDARVLNWELSPGDRRQLSIDLNDMTFTGALTVDGRRPAMEFVRRIPPADRLITVIVWHGTADGRIAVVEEPVRFP